jgi:uncharacterized membrane protein
MRTAAPIRRMCLQLAATVVACAILCLASTASAQQPAPKVQSYTEVPDRSAALAALGVDFDRWLQSGDRNELSGIKGYAITPMGISADAAVITGTFKTSPKEDNSRVFVWSKADGFKDIGKIEGGAVVDFISNDGSVVIWHRFEFTKGGFETHLIRWSKTGGAKELGRIEGMRFPNAVSADCSEIVGSPSIGNDGQGFRWTLQDGLQNFPAMDHPLDVSADGTVILGIKGDRVIRWTQAGGAQDLGTLKTDGKAKAYPVEASVSRAEIVGFLFTDAHDKVPASWHALLWTQTGGPQDLGSVAGKNTELIGISSDGTLVAGHLMPEDANGKNVYFVQPLADLVAKRQAELKHKQAQEQAQAAAQAEQDAKKAAIQADQQARYDKAMKTGRPIQLYSLAGHLEDEGRPDLAANLYQALIDKFPDDPYAAKAVDKQDAARAAAQQQQAQDSAGQTAASAASPQAVEACLQQCSTTLSSCKSDAQNQHDGAVAKGLVGLLTRNSGSVSSAGTDSQNADDAKSACNDSYNSCSAACQ